MIKLKLSNLIDKFRRTTESRKQRNWIARYGAHSTEIDVVKYSPAARRLIRRLWIRWLASPEGRTLDGARVISCLLSLSVSLVSQSTPSVAKPQAMANILPLA